MTSSFRLTSWLARHHSPAPPLNILTTSPIRVATSIHLIMKNGKNLSGYRRSVSKTRNLLVPSGIRGQRFKCAHSLSEPNQHGGQPKFQHLLEWVDDKQYLCTLFSDLRHLLISQPKNLQDVERSGRCEDPQAQP